MNTHTSHVAGLGSKKPLLVSELKQFYKQLAANCAPLKMGHAPLAIFLFDDERNRQFLAEGDLTEAEQIKIRDSIQWLNLATKEYSDLFREVFSGIENLPDTIEELRGKKSAIVDAVKARFRLMGDSDSHLIPESCEDIGRAFDDTVEAFAKSRGRAGVAD